MENSNGNYYYQRAKITFKSLLLIFAAIPSMSLAQGYEKWDTGSDSIIFREVATHKIVNKELIAMIVEYDRMYSPIISDSTLGITISCRVSKKTITYSVNYMAGFGGKSPILLCEPINGRDVHIYLGEMNKQVQLPHMHTVELLKNSNPSLYDDYKFRQKEIEKIEQGSFVVIDVISDFVHWSITFDKYTGKCLKKITPDRTKQYKKMKR